MIQAPVRKRHDFGAKSKNIKLLKPVLTTNYLTTGPDFGRKTAQKMKTANYPNYHTKKNIY